jgi:hypothetical protein
MQDAVGFTAKTLIQALTRFHAVLPCVTAVHCLLALQVCFVDLRALPAAAKAVSAKGFAVLLSMLAGAAKLDGLELAQAVEATDRQTKVGDCLLSLCGGFESTPPVTAAATEQQATLPACLNAECRHYMCATAAQKLLQATNLTAQQPVQRVFRRWLWWGALTHGQPPTVL